MGERVVTELALLAAWEGGYGRPPADRAVVLAALASGLPAGEIADLALGQCDLLLLQLREECFGPALTGLTRCPGCGAELDVGIDLGELRVNADRLMSPPTAGRRGGAGGDATAEGVPVPSGSVTVGGRDVPVRPLTMGDLLACGGDRGRLLTRCLAVESVASALPQEPGLLEAIEAQLDILDPQAAAGIDLDCPECGASWHAAVDVAEFVWSEVDRFARRLLHDVHTLASAYGWTEADVLTVSPARRRFYLQACAS